MDIKPCRFEDLHNYEEDCKDDKDHRITVCDTQNQSKCTFNDFVGNYTRVCFCRRGVLLCTGEECLSGNCLMKAMEMNNFIDHIL